MNNSKLHSNFSLTQSQLERVLAKARSNLSRVAFSEVYLQKGASLSLFYDQGSLKRTSNNIVNGGGVRTVDGDRQGYSYTDNPNFRSLYKAAGFSRSILDSPGTASESVEIPSASPAAHDLYPLSESLLSVSVKQCLDLIHDIDQLARSFDPRIVNVSVSLGIEEYSILVANSLDEIVSDCRPLVRLSVSCLAAEGNRKESGSGGGGGRVDFSFLLEDDRWREYTLGAAREAIEMLSSVPAPAGELTVVLGPGWPGVLIHEAVGHGLEADFNRKGTSLFSGKVGELVASPLCTIVDQGDIPGRRGSLNYDDEGAPTGTTVLIENGVLRGYMQDRLNASLMGASLTGNGRRQSYRHLPMPRMTNTYLVGGQSEPGEIIESVKYGIYAASFAGGQVDITSGDFTFSASLAYLIEDGKLTTPVKGATLIGNGPRSMQRISMVGNDSSLDRGIGVCGKDGQSVPVGVGMPTLRIDAVTVGGTGN